MVLARRFEPGTLLTVKLESQSDHFTLTMPVRVVRVTPLSNGAWILGCSFTDKLYADEVQTLVRASAKVSNELNPRLSCATRGSLALQTNNRVGPGRRGGASG
jgi:hypothetical protein